MMRTGASKGANSARRKRIVRTMFDNLVRNALDFINKALFSLRKDPKASVIFFWGGVELFLKARLLKEHWALVLVEPAKADLDKFKSGDFQSITFQEAIKRLKCVCRLRVAGSDNPCFKMLRKHRNRIMHFFHDDYSPPEKKKALERIVKEQYRSWYYLHRWLSEDWKKEFRNYQGQIATIQRRMKRYREYLLIRFEEIGPELEKLRQKGIAVFPCHVCRCKAAVESTKDEFDDAKIMESRCLVCDTSRDFLKVPCPECEKYIIVEDLGEGTCENCSERIGLHFLVGKYGEEKNPRDEMYDPSNAYCHECECTEERTVVPLSEWRHICLNCLTIHEGVSQCNYCGERVTGDTADSYVLGCVICCGMGDPV